MTTDELIDDLETRGFALRIDAGRLWVHPADQLTSSDIDRIRSDRDAIISEIDLRELDRSIVARSDAGLFGGFDINLGVRR